MTPAALAAVLALPESDEATVRSELLETIEAESPTMDKLLSTMGEHGYDDLTTKEIIWRLIDDRVVRLTGDWRLLLVTPG